MTANAKDPLEGQLVNEAYRLQQRIGTGGMSVVYLAASEGNGRPMAIKFLRSAFAKLPDFVQRFEQEAQACRILNHLNCVDVVDFGVAFGSPFLVMEYVGGTPLSRVVAQGPIPIPRTIAITRQILEGLRHAHEKGVVHRDLKPGNIRLIETDDSEAGQETRGAGSDCYVKIMDFGTAQLMKDGPIKRRGTEVGTPWYMAPEQAAGQHTDQRTDLYAVGVMLFEMLTGERPFTAEDPLRVLQMHLESPIPSARALKPEMGISPELEATIVRAMQKQPKERFSSAKEFNEALAQTPEVAPRRKAAAQPEAPPKEASPKASPKEASVHKKEEPAARPTWILWVIISGLIAAGLVLFLLARVEL